MRLKSRKFANNEKGMTLIEIMIVLAILAGIASILVTTVTGRLKKARMQQAKIQISEYMKQLDMYMTDCGNYPETDYGLNALVEQPQDGSCPNWGPEPYLKASGRDDGKWLDPWGGEYYYEKINGDYVILSFGADRREGGTGENADISSDEI
ncbi:MAG: type II secretion system major pseudopilin GspG [Bdellovibrionales bacterium]|nr:type II secretion system major pseudopilin GspG [Bdellovibrionales bacterium]